MFLQRHIIVIALACITITMCHPTTSKANVRRHKRKSSKRNPTESDCLKNFCENDTSYPTEKVNALLKENSLPVFYMDWYEPPTERFAVHGEHLCQIATRTAFPKRAQTGFGTKEYVVQSDGTRQSIYIEVCLDAEPKELNQMCLPNGYSLFCQQQYRTIPLWVYDEKKKNLKSTKFKVPSGCTVHFAKNAKLLG